MGRCTGTYFCLIFPCRDFVCILTHFTPLSHTMNWIQSLTSVTVVLWKISLLYTQCSHGARAVLFSCSRTSVEKQDGSACESTRRLMFRFRDTGEEDTLPDSELELSRQWWGGVAPVKMITTMWKARRIWGRQIHTYKIFWYFPNPPIAARIWSKFISAIYLNCTCNLGKCICLF